MTTFDSFALRPELAQAVTELGFENPMPIQSAVIPAMLAGQDVIGQAQTGTGKTAAFGLPLLHKLQPDGARTQSLVLAPTRELALQVARALSDFGRQTGARVLAVYGGQPYGPQITQIRRGVDVIVGTPGRLIDLMEKDVLDLSGVHTVVLDEADEMLSMGFVEDIEKILAATPTERQTALFSATLSAEIRRLAGRYLRDPFSATIQQEQVTVDRIQQRYYLVNRGEKLAALTRLMEVEEITRAIVFVRTRGEAGELAHQLSQRSFPAEAISGDLTQEARERTLARFRQNEIQVLVATDVAARGLDIDDVSHVFNYTLPDDPEVYVHRIGRTGRAGKEGQAISLLTLPEMRRLRQVEAFIRRRIERAAVPGEEEIRAMREQALVQRVSIWLQRGRTRRERELVDQLAEAGFDPLEIAAAALKVARAEEKQRPIEPMSEVPERRPAAERATGERRERSTPASRLASRSHEQGMVRLSLDLGRTHGVRVNDIVGAIAAEANIPGKAIGKIHIHDRHTFVDVPEELASQVLARTGRMYVRRQQMNLQRA